MIDSRLVNLAMRSIHSFILWKNSIFYRLMNTKNVPFAIFETCSFHWALYCYAILSFDSWHIIFLKINSFSSQHVDLLFDSRNLECGHSMVCFWRAALVDLYESAAATFKRAIPDVLSLLSRTGLSPNVVS